MIIYLSIQYIISIEQYTIRYKVSIEGLEQKRSKYFFIYVNLEHFPLSSLNIEVEKKSALYTKKLHKFIETINVSMLCVDVLKQHL